MRHLWIFFWLGILAGPLVLLATHGARVIERVSVASDGTQGNDDSFHPSVSADGRFVAFDSRAENLAPSVVGQRNVFLRDTCIGAPAGCTPSTILVSQCTGGGFNDSSSFSDSPSVSADGRFVAFDSNCASLHPRGFVTNSVYLFDTCIGAPAGCTPSTIFVSEAAPFGVTDSGDSFLPSISADGRFVAFESQADLLPPGGDENETTDVYVRDTCVGAPSGCTPSTIRVSVASDGSEIARGGRSPSISADGRFVAFVNGDDGHAYVRDTCVGALAGCTPSSLLVSVASDGTEANSFSSIPSINADGRFVAFESRATNLVPNDTNGLVDVFVRDTCVGAPAGCTPSTVRASVANDGSQANGAPSQPSLSADGRFVAFGSVADNLVADDTNFSPDIFVRDTCLGATMDCVPSTARASLASDGTQGVTGVNSAPSISADGRFVGFYSNVFDLVPGDTNSSFDVFLAGTGFGENPLPAITGLLPDTIPAGSSAFTLSVKGAGFIPVSVVRWNGSDRPTTFISSTELHADISASDVTAVGRAEVTVFSPIPGGGVSNPLELTIDLRNPVPTLVSLSPAGAVEGGTDFTLVLFGSNFVFNSVVRWNGADRATTFVNENQLQALIPASDIAATGTATVTVFTPSPGGGTSNGLDFPIQSAPNPVPSITSLSPALPIAGVRGGSTLTVSGNDFVPGAVVLWDGSARPTNFDDPTQVRASLLDIDTARAGTVDVMVANPEPGGGVSPAFAYDILNPLPGQPALFPSDLPAGSPGFLLTATGANYVPESVIRWNGMDRPTTYVDGTQLRAVIDATDVATAGTADVTVFNPLPGGGESPAGAFTISAALNPVPAINSLTPSSAPAGRTGFLLTVDGSDFVPGSVVRWDGTDRATTFLSTTQMVAVISDTDVAAAGIVNVTVFNPAPGGGESAPATFTLTAPPMAATTPHTISPLATTTQKTQAPAGSGSATRSAAPLKESPVPEELTAAITLVFGGAPNPLPAIETLEPKSVAAGSAQLTLMVKGTGFVRGSVVRWNGVNRETTFVSSTELQADIPAEDLQRAGAVEVTVFNPAPGGGSSNTLAFTISP